MAIRCKLHNFLEFYSTARDWQEVSSQSCPSRWYDLGFPLSLAMFVKPQCRLDNLSIQFCQRYPAVCSHTAANSCRGYFTVLWIATSSIRNTQYLTVLRVFAGIQNLIQLFPYGWERLLQYRWRLSNAAWELGFTEAHNLSYHIWVHPLRGDNRFPRRKSDLGYNVKSSM